MKTIISLFVILLLVVKAGAQDIAVISGYVEEKDLNYICLYKVVDGATVECLKCPVSEDRTFKMEYLPEYEGFYAIGHPEKKNMFYLKKGDRVNLRVQQRRIVLVDVWATWCGPCQQQIPHLLKLEEELRDSGIIFMGVSLDKAQDREKWLQVVKDKGLKGVQLFADGWSQITKDYEIKGIPRFIVIDKDGKLVARQAPVPSDPALKQMLLKLLEK